MRPGREVDARIAKEVFGYNVWAKNKVLFESAPLGERPLRNYSKDIEWAWEVANHLKMTLIPIEGGQWFAFVGPTAKDGWESPQAVLSFLEAGDFAESGAALGDKIAQVICEAALKAVEKRNANQIPAETVSDQALESEEIF